LIASGARPIIYIICKVLLGTGDGVIYPTPSWNNNHYYHLMGAKQYCMETLPENNLLRTAAEIALYVMDARLLALCSSLNPTGTTFTEEALRGICTLVLDENKRCGSAKKTALCDLRSNLFDAHL
jgi:aspartate aminotransferase